MSVNNITVGSVVFHTNPDWFDIAKHHFSGPGTVLMVEDGVAKVMWQTSTLKGPSFHSVQHLIPAGQVMKKDLSS